LTTVRLPRDVRAVIFDMDGLLLDTESIAKAAIQKGGEAIGFPIPDEVCFSMIGVPAVENDIQLIAHFGADFPLERWREAAYAEFAAARAQGAIKLKPGVPEILDHLEDLSMPRAVATSSMRESVERHLTQTGILHRFGAIVTRNDVTKGKPDPEVFLKAAAALNATPSSCLVLEDSYHGVRAAHAAGMMPVMIPDLLEATDEMRRLCVHVVNSLHEIPPLLR
jgi:HAD superfamily hydrolase (TIGR01509 family)